MLPNTPSSSNVYRAQNTLDLGIFFNMMIGMIEKRYIRDLVSRIAQSFHPQKVILFGSYANGEPTEDSDVDLLVVMNHDKARNVEQAIEIQLAAKASFPIDLIVRRPDEIRDRLAMNDSFLLYLFRSGEVLYG